ncbi:hypothetical protein ANO11243_091050 [Dothideomycetidae sp. 11243]|nr:hypothetical protein ANO11243_091050 [fungal sp. No.11243]
MVVQKYMASGDIGPPLLAVGMPVDPTGHGFGVIKVCAKRRRAPAKSSPNPGKVPPHLDALRQGRHGPCANIAIDVPPGRSFLSSLPTSFHKRLTPPCTSLVAVAPIMTMDTIKPTKEGKVPFKVPSIDTPCFTRYQVYGDLSKGTPLICVHAGPAGSLAGEFEVVPIWQRLGLPVVLYDQIGCGESSLVPEKHDDKSFWQMPLFISQLDSLVDSLQLRDGFTLSGVSWGAAVAVDYATSRPRGLKKLMLFSPYASIELFQAAIDERIAELPEKTQKAIAHADETREYDSKAYKHALFAFFQHTWLREKHWDPKWLYLVFESGWLEDPVRVMLGGRSPMRPIESSLREWSVIPRLHRIEVPTLMFNGEFDASYERASRPFFERIPRVRWVVIPDEGQAVIGHGKRHERAVKILEEFLSASYISPAQDEEKEDKQRQHASPYNKVELYADEKAHLLEHDESLVALYDGPAKTRDSRSATRIMRAIVAFGAFSLVITWLIHYLPSLACGALSADDKEGRDACWSVTWISGEKLSNLATELPFADDDPNSFCAVYSPNVQASAGFLVADGLGAG